MTIIVGLFAFANTQDMDSTFIILSIFPTVIFWLLDGFFLHQEKLFIELYNHVRKQKEEVIDFTMDTSEHKGNVSSWIVVCFSKTLRLFYIPIIIVIVLAMLALPYLSQ
ncbi:hypothetical protein BBR01nite_12190 [Brevibacillus brevis]|nr:hypothetical protein BBR01nite_12190 [Brevibacillus brevis]